MFKTVFSLTFLCISSIPALAGSISNAASGENLQLNAQDQTAYNAALLELKETNLQFSCASDNYKIQTTLYAKMVSSAPTVTFDENDQVVAIEEVSSRPCAEGEIALTNYCASLVCTYTHVLTQEEAAKMLREENKKREAGNALLKSQGIY